MVSIVRLLLALSVALVILGCEPSRQRPDIASTPVAHLPVHFEPLVTDWGRHHIMGKLIVDSGCLRVLGDAGPNGPTPSYLLVWPDGYTLNSEGDAISSEGTIVVAEVGDNVRFSGRLVRDESYYSQQLASSAPRECVGPYYIVGDDVSVVQDEESTELSLPGRVAGFRRRATSPMVPGWTAYPPVPWGASGVLTVKNGCLLIDLEENIHEEMRMIEWPPGFYPDLHDGDIVVRNGGGRVVARTGDSLKMTMLAAGGDSEGAFVPECNARLWAAQKVSNDTLPITLLRHGQVSSSGQVVVSAEHYSERMVNEEFRNRHRQTTLEITNGCTYAGEHILVWPDGFSIGQDDRGITVVDQRGELVAREGQDVVLKVKSIRRDDLLGREIVQKTPPDCDGNYLFVGH